MTGFLRDRKSIIGMIHVGALPGTPRSCTPLPRIIEQAVAEAQLYQTAGVDAIALENMHDIPYLRGAVGPEITAAMAVLAREVKQASGLPCGVQILAGANREALAVALAGGLDFVRVEGFVFGHVADEGYIESCAGDLLRYRRQIGAESVLVLTDIKKKHSAHAVTSDVDIAETARAARFFLSDGVVVTGTATGAATDLEELRQVKTSVDLPVLVGSGVTIDNVDAYLAVADALIVGSWFKQDGRWDRPVDARRAARFMEKVRLLREGLPLP